MGHKGTRVGFLCELMGKKSKAIEVTQDLLEKAIEINRDEYSSLTMFSSVTKYELDEVIKLITKTYRELLNEEGECIVVDDFLIDLYIRASYFDDAFGTGIGVKDGNMPFYDKSSEISIPKDGLGTKVESIKVNNSDIIDDNEETIKSNIITKAKYNDYIKKVMDKGLNEVNQ